MTAHHYRTIAAKLVLSGIADPMALPSLTSLLNVTEQMMLESCSKASERDRIISQLYRPDPIEMRRSRVNPTVITAPAGFSEDEQRAAFEAFQKAAH